MADTIILFDTETTGLVEKEPMKLEKQPRIVEFAGIKIDYDTLEEVDRLEFICDPQVQLTDLIIKITGIQNEAGIKDEDGNELAHIQNKKPFNGHLRELVGFFFNTRHMIAHNLTFDRDMIWYELKRLGFLARFPWPPNHMCMVEKTKHIMGYDLKLHALYEHLFDEKFEGAHRAMNDVEAMTKCFRELRKRRLI